MLSSPNQKLVPKHENDSWSSYIAMAQAYDIMNKGSPNFSSIIFVVQFHKIRTWFLDFIVQISYLAMSSNTINLKTRHQNKTVLYQHHNPISECNFTKFRINYFKIINKKAKPQISIACCQPTNTLGEANLWLERANVVLNDFQIGNKPIFLLKT